MLFTCCAWQVGYLLFIVLGAVEKIPAAHTKAENGRAAVIGRDGLKPQTLNLS